jgi:cation:H+ antiporter
MILQVLLLAVAILMLYYGAEFALESAEKIGLAFGLSPLVIGLLIVGFGTSLPEFFVSQLATLRGEPEIALGNIVGSNIANLFLILGVSGVITPLFILRSEITVQFVFHIVITALLAYFLTLPQLPWWAGLVFGVFFLIYLWDTFRLMIKKRGQLGEVDEFTEAEEVNLKDIAFLLLGFILLYFGGELLVTSGSAVAKMVGVSSYVISAVFVAFGTSFPELVTAIMACARKKNTDIITGNIIGSNIFNVAFVLGSLSFYKVPIEQNFTIEIAVLAFAAIFLIVLAVIKKNFTRWAGVLFLGIYIFAVYNWVK